MKDKEQDLDEENPYAPPSAPPLPQSHGPGGASLADFRREGNKLVVTKGARLPDICLVTGEPTAPEQRRARRLYWTPSWVIALILVNLLVLIVVALLVRKSAMVTYSLSPEATRRLRMGKLLGSVLFIGGLVSFFIFPMYDIWRLWFLVGITAIVAALIVFFVVRGPYPSKIDVRFIWLAGIKPDVLDRIMAAGEQPAASDWAVPAASRGYHS